MTDYWKKNEPFKEVITTTIIPNVGNYSLLACSYNVLNSKGLAFQFNKIEDFKTDIVFRKNGFEYLVFEHENFQELLILPNDNLMGLTERIVSKIDFCTKESEILDLILQEL